MRYPVPGVDYIRPGMLVYTSRTTFSEAADPTGLFLFALAQAPELTFRCRRELVLPRAQYLHRQPAQDFWALVASWEYGQAGRPCFVQDVATGGLGERPFRFESPGELHHYAVERELKLSDFMIAHIQKMKSP